MMIPPWPLPSLRQENKLEINRHNWKEPNAITVKRVSEWDIIEHNYVTWYELWAEFPEEVPKKSFDGPVEVKQVWTSFVHWDASPYESHFSETGLPTKFNTIDDAIKAYRTWHEDMFEHPRKEDFIRVDMTTFNY